MARDASLVHVGAIAVLSIAVAYGFVRAIIPKDNAPTHEKDGSVTFTAKTAKFVFRPSNGEITIIGSDGKPAGNVDLAYVVDEVPRAITLTPDQITLRDHDTFAASFPIDLGKSQAMALLDLRIEGHGEALVADLSVIGENASDHEAALRMSFSSEKNGTFVSGVGEINDVGSVTGSNVVAISASRPIGVTSLLGTVAVATSEDVWADQKGGAKKAPLRIAVTSAQEPVAASDARHTDLRLVLGDSSSRIWGELYHAVAHETAHVTGVVTGTRERAHVYGLDAEGVPQVRADVGDDQRFDVEVPKTVVQWYAALDLARTSPPVTFPPGTGYDLKLDVSPGGDLHVTVRDMDTGAPLVARLVVHGVDGSLDPNFGPDYRASGAGPIIDSRSGDVATPLPAGRYRILATRGIEWSVDSKTIDLASGRSVTVDLALRHVVPTPGIVGCDLHVHARPSFDTPVSVEDRVLSLVAAGVDFAVPSEHNIVGNYSPALDTLGLTKDLATVNGVEITTFSPRFGHFGLFPYPLGAPPPYRGTNATAVFNAAHTDPARVFLVNHPRLSHGIGYFDVFHFDPNAPAPPPAMRTDFDGIEAYNGFDLAEPKRVEAVLVDYFALLNQGHHYIVTGSSDSHRIQYQWAGYPRTMVSVGAKAAGDSGDAIDPLAVVANIKRGHATVTSGPLIELEASDARPGDAIDIAATDTSVHAHLRIRAAPWIDVTRAEIVVSGQTVQTIPIESRPTNFGPEPGTRQESEARTIRYDADINVPITRDAPKDKTWFLVIVRGERPADDVLPFMPFVPMGFTNPIWIRRP